MLNLTTIIRNHSSRMHITCLPTIPNTSHSNHQMSSLVGGFSSEEIGTGLVLTTRCHQQGCPQVNKFEEVSSPGHQMSLPARLARGQGKGVPVQRRLGLGGPCTESKGWVEEIPAQRGHQSQWSPYIVRSNASQVLVTWNPWGQTNTHATENITFP